MPQNLNILTILALAGFAAWPIGLGIIGYKLRRGIAVTISMACLGIPATLVPSKLAPYLARDWARLSLYAWMILGILIALGALFYRVAKPKSYEVTLPIPLPPGQEISS